MALVCFQKTNLLLKQTTRKKHSSKMHAAINIVIQCPLPYEDTDQFMQPLSNVASNAEKLRVIKTSLSYPLGDWNVKK